METQTVRGPAAAARVLVVEDEGIIAFDIAAMLQNLGYDVVGIAATGSDALQLALAERPDLVLMDIRIRGDSDGVQTAQRIRDRIGVPVVYLTAHADDATLQRAKLTEPAGYIVKPFTSVDIKVAIEISLQRHKTQRRLQEREAELSAILRNLSDAVLVCDEQQRVKRTNPAAEALLGLKAADLCGKRASELFEFRSEKLDGRTLLPALVKPAEPRLTTGILIRPDGQQRVVISSVATMHDELAGARETVMLFRELPDLDSLYKALRQKDNDLKRASEDLTERSSGLVHDLQQPLQTIAFASQVLAEGPQNVSSDSGAQYLTWITEGCTRMQAMIASLLDHYGAGAQGGSVITVRSGDVIASALLNLQAAVLESGAVIEISELPEVNADPIALMQVFQNLIGNALKFRGEEIPRITISAQLDGPYWTFTVADNSMGFHESQRETIFSLFKRAHGSDLPGHGIGLATCRKLVEQAGGRIWAESTLGEGSRFYFTFPAVSPSVPV